MRLRAGVCSSWPVPDHGSHPDIAAWGTDPCAPSHRCLRFSRRYPAAIFGCEVMTIIVIDSSRKVLRARALAWGHGRRASGASCHQGVVQKIEAGCHGQVPTRMCGTLSAQTASGPGGGNGGGSGHRSTDQATAAVVTGHPYAASFSMNSGKKLGSRSDQPGAVAAASLIEWSSVLRRSGRICGSAAAPQKAPGSHGRAHAPSSRS